MTEDNAPETRSYSLARAWAVSAEVGVVTAFWFVFLRNIVCDGLVFSITGEWWGLSLTGNQRLWEMLVIAQCSILLGAATYRFVQRDRVLGLVCGSVLWGGWIWMTNSGNAPVASAALDVLLALACVQVGVLLARATEHSSNRLLRHRVWMPLLLTLVLALCTCAGIAISVWHR